MNKDFFKIDYKITLLDIIEILDVSSSDLSFEIDDFVLYPDKIYIEKF